MRGDRGVVVEEDLAVGEVDGVGAGVAAERLHRRAHHAAARCGDLAAGAVRAGRPWPSAPVVPVGRSRGRPGRPVAPVLPRRRRSAPVRPVGRCAARAGRAGPARSRRAAATAALAPDARRARAQGRAASASDPDAARRARTRGRSIGSWPASRAADGRAVPARDVARAQLARRRQ